MDKTRAEIKAMIGRPFRLRKVSFSDLARGGAYEFSFQFENGKWYYLHNAITYKLSEKDQRLILAAQLLKTFTYKGLRII